MNQTGTQHRRFALCVLGLLCCLGCQAWSVNRLPDRLSPSNHRDWVADMDRLPVGEVQQGQVTVRNFRNCNYVTESDFVVSYQDITFPLADVASVDFIVVPFQKTPIIAHTMLSFGLRDGRFLCVSAEIRKELGEDYTPWLGTTNQFELSYVIADEKDLIRLRTRHRDAEVYIYPTVADANAAQRLLLRVLDRVNQLGAKPEFYHTITNNCTTNIADLVNEILPEKKVALGSWSVMLPGLSPQYAYDLGLLDQTLPFAELKRVALINDLAEQHFYAADFSQQIRSRLFRIRETSGDSDETLNLNIEADRRTEDLLWR